VIHEKKNGEILQFEGIFLDWKLNVDFPDAIFDFVAPENARRLNIVSKSSTY
jgi:outer membrane lipoprotein-sorting protein